MGKLREKKGNEQPLPTPMSHYPVLYIKKRVLWKN